MIKILIIGVGNILLKDEGAGVYVVQQLEKLNLPPEVQVIDAGTELLNFISSIEQTEKLIVIDAIETGAPPGTIFKLTDKDISEPPNKLYSLHQFSLLNTLKILEKTGKKPPTIIIGIEPKEVSMEMKLSPEIEKKIPKIIDLILKEIPFYFTVSQF